MADERLSLTRYARDQARQLGFELFGVTPADPLAGAEFYARWAALGLAGDMAYLERNQERRADPRLLVPGARSVICLGMHYDPPAAATEAGRDPSRPVGRMARYARGDDYHEVVKRRLSVLWDRLCAHVGAGCEGRWFVDTAPVLERELAARAGLGWWGKNTCLINRRAGSYFFLAEIVTSLELRPDEPAVDHCGSCTRCLDACPTDAFPEAYVLDARRCISYLTIELKSAIPVDLRPGVGDWILGCDVCQEVCPWNRRAAATREAAFHARDGLDPVDLLALLGMDRDAFNERFRRNPAKRPKRRGMLRNAAVALGNSGQRQVVPALSRSLHEEPEALVRAHVAWALGQLGGDDARAALAAARQTEPEASVREEIDAALQADG
jgi:epoxyqueuosine reductase